MTAPKPTNLSSSSSSSSSSFEHPKVKIEGHGSSKLKKHVTIKSDPEHIGGSNKNSSTTKSILSSSNNLAAVGKTSDSNTANNNKKNSTSKIPITPNEKILNNPNLKSIDQNFNISKFYIQPQVGDGNGSTSIGNNFDETPTKSNSKKHELQKIEKSLKRSASTIKSKSLPEKDTSTSTINIVHKKPKISPKLPIPFKSIEESIISNIDYDNLNISQIFQSIDEDSIKSKYMNYSSLEFNKWSEKGMILINSQYDIIKKIIISRTKLNLKFKLIFKLINKYGEGLENEDKKLKEKMNKLENLGMEIKNFII